MCGKNGRIRQRSFFFRGSPPRVREKRLVDPLQYEMSRITPACAGKTYWLISYRLFFKDHPRVCGKNRCLRRERVCRLGSPPRVREKLKTCEINITCRGITPACAGKTLSQSKSHKSAWDHPRVCGKNAGSSAYSPWSTEDHPRVCGKNGRCNPQPLKGRGSPPRVREKLIRSPVQSCVN